MAERTKHWDFKIHYIRTCVQNFVLSFAYVSTKDQMADGNTKALPRDQFRRERDHNNGTLRQEFLVNDKIFRENSG